MNMPDLKPRLSSEGRLLHTGRGWRLVIPPGGAKSYRLAQLDDQAGKRRRDYLWTPPLRLELRARASMQSGPGTWGFGFWNDPYGFSFGPGETFPRFPALPQALWFFCASPRCYLSFRDDKPANGLYAQVLHGTGLSSKLVGAALALPVAPRTSRRLLQTAILEDGAAIVVDPRSWHAYRMDWTTTGSSLEVDGSSVLRTTISPKAPLGLVIWIDNQYAAFDPAGRIRWGVEANAQEQWLEIEDVRLSQ